MKFGLRRNPKAIEHFVSNGYVVYERPIVTGVVQEAANFLFKEYEREQKLADGVLNVHEAAVRIMERFERTDSYGIVTYTPTALLQDYLGPDICLLGYDALWINVPKDKNPVLLKGIHQDAWTGTSVNTIFAKTFFTDCDQYNGVTVYPGSHLQGMLPVRNRAVDPAAKVKFKGVNLKDIKAGDVLMWHPLLLHSTTGHSGKNIRISMTSRYSSTETAFSSQERALGYLTLSVGPMNKILRLIGNDSLTPLRTYGGVVAIDKRMRKVYGD